MEQQELARERAYVAQVQQLLYEVIRRAEAASRFRMRPYA